MVLNVTVKFSDRPGVVIAVEPAWNIYQLKKQIEGSLDVPFAEIRLIFQGRELEDDMLLTECDFGNFSILHAVRHTGKHESGKNTSPKQQDSHIVESAEAHQVHHGALASLSSAGPLSIPAVYRPQFFVYCKSVCSTICPGKLRVRCINCKQGLLTVARDPESWEDVLVSGKIQGLCQDKNCSGNIAEFYFKCAGHSGPENEYAVPLDLVKSNLRNVPCIACMEISNPIVVFPCILGHSICIDCFKSYCLVKLSERGFVQTEEHGYTLPCPAGCDNSFIQEAHHFQLLGTEQYDRYQRFAAEECTLKLGGVFCPAPDCGAGLLANEGVRRMECQQGCGLVFCRLCRQAYHQGDCSVNSSTIGATATSGYSIDPKNAEQAQWERQSQDTIQKTTKKCPMCGVPTERNGGCMHMVCTQCQYEWCWQCKDEWNRTCQGDHWFG